MKILTIFGTRPEAIKLAPIIKELSTKHTVFESKVCVTGQHREMLDQALDIFSIKPDYDLRIMTPSQDLFDVTSRTLLGLRRILQIENPEWVLVQGDTTTAAIAALSAYYCQIKVGHIEAGLRTHQKYAPFPEEINRRIIDLVADLYFATTSTARDNLLREGVANEKIIVTGNSVIDALLWVANKVKDQLNPIEELTNLAWDKKVVLVTGHRRESFGKGFQVLCEALVQIAQSYPQIEIVYVMHLNPQVRQHVIGRLQHLPNIHLLPPQNYENFVWLMSKAYLILTDSGGIQEEAPALNKPLLVIREVTERPEGIWSGTTKLVGIDKEKIITNVIHLLSDDEAYQEMAHAQNPYGDGEASVRILEALTRAGREL